MTAIMNGNALHGGFVPYGATFLMFMEYARNAMRQGCLDESSRNIKAYRTTLLVLAKMVQLTNQLSKSLSLRLTPNMSTWRPCDQVESAVAWKLAIERKDGPLNLLRQTLHSKSVAVHKVANIAKAVVTS
ncbi:hypothetical protein OH492_09715 [Vibrio chagasii]|nr:hypothetical protein [Vibrio chagasii]